VEDADSLILLDADRRKMRPEEFRTLSDLALYSGQTFEGVYQGAKLKDWVDSSKVRLLPRACPSTIEGHPFARGEDLGVLPLAARLPFRRAIS
jgi:hypothetical protein